MPNSIQASSRSVLAQIGASSCSTTDSAYRSGIAEYSYLVIEETGAPAYCVDPTLYTPRLGYYLEPTSLPASMPTLSETQIRALHYIARSAYPIFDRNTFFWKAGVDPISEPALTDLDAYAAVQTAIWLIYYDIAPDTQVPLFYLCEDQDAEVKTPHPKNQRLTQAAQYYWNLALTRAASAPAPAELYISPPLPQSLDEPVDGALRIGPISVLSTFEEPLPIDITAEGAQIARLDGEVLGGQHTIAPGESFYLLVECTGGGQSLTLTARQNVPVGMSAMRSTGEPARAGLEPYDPANDQPVGLFGILVETATVSERLSFSCEAPPVPPVCPECPECPECPKCPECPPCPEPHECPECPKCPVCPECPTKPTCPGESSCERHPSPSCRCGCGRRTDCARGRVMPNCAYRAQTSSFANPRKGSGKP